MTSCYCLKDLKPLTCVCTKQNAATTVRPTAMPLTSALPSTTIPNILRNLATRVQHAPGLAPGNPIPHPVVPTIKILKTGKMKKG